MGGLIAGSSSGGGERGDAGDVGGPVSEGGMDIGGLVLQEQGLRGGVSLATTGADTASDGWGTSRRLHCGGCRDDLLRGMLRRKGGEGGRKGRGQNLKRAVVWFHHPLSPLMVQSLSYKIRLA